MVASRRFARDSDQKLGVMQRRTPHSWRRSGGSGIVRGTSGVHAEPRQRHNGAPTAVSDTNYPVELTPPDIEPYRKGNTGIDYITSFDSGTPGPHVAVFALTHGNEICGAIAVDRLFKLGVKPARGKLSLAFSNVGAFKTFDPKSPSASRFIDEDINRVWDVATLDGPRKSAELARARQLRPFIDTVDTLLDIHSMQHATPALMLTGLLGKSLELAHRVGAP